MTNARILTIFTLQGSTKSDRHDQMFPFYKGTSCKQTYYRILKHSKIRELIEQSDVETNHDSCLQHRLGLFEKTEVADKSDTDQLINAILNQAKMV